MAREITYLSDVYLITCVVESGLADMIVDAATKLEPKVLLSTMQEALELEIEWAF